MVAGAFFFSAMSALVKIAGARFPTMEVVFARSVVVLVLSALALLRSGTSFTGSERGLLVLRGLFGFAGLTCFYYGLVHLPLAEATVIQYTNPVWTALIAALVLKEWIGRRQMALALLSLVGVAIVARPGPLASGAVAVLDPVAVAVALAGAVFSAAANVTVRRLKNEPAMVVVFYFALFSTVLSLPWLWMEAVLPRGTDWLLLAAIGVTTHLGQVFLTWGLQREAAGRAMSVGYLQIVFAACWGALLFGDLPDGWVLLGAALIVGSTVILARLPSPVARVVKVRPGL
jgi:drug/metabolite transporter (DMT)-like permease